MIQKTSSQVIDSFVFFMSTVKLPKLSTMIFSGFCKKSHDKDIEAAENSISKFSR